MSSSGSVLAGRVSISVFDSCSEHSEIILSKVSTDSSSTDVNASKEMIAIE